MPASLADADEKVCCVEMSWCGQLGPSQHPAATLSDAGSQDGIVKHGTGPLLPFRRRTRSGRIGEPWPRRDVSKQQAKVAEHHVLPHAARESFTQKLWHDVCCCRPGWSHKARMCRQGKIAVRFCVSWLERLPCSPSKTQAAEGTKPQGRQQNNRRYGPATPATTLHTTHTPQRCRHPSYPPPTHTHTIGMARRSEHRSRSPAAATHHHRASNSSRRDSSKRHRWAGSRQQHVRTHSTTESAAHTIPTVPGTPQIKELLP